MTRMARRMDRDMENFKVVQRACGGGTAWLDELRAKGQKRFGEVGFPNGKTEAWRFTNVAPIANTVFSPAEVDDSAAARKWVEEYSFKDQAAAELVFVNGHFMPQWSKRGQLGKGAWAGSLCEALESRAKAVEGHLGRHAKIEDNPFVALNTGMIDQGAMVELGRGVTVEGPIHLLFVTMAGGTATVSHPRVLVVAGENSECSIVESYAGGGEGTYWTNAVTEIVGAPDSRIAHARLQQETTGAYHVSTTQTFLDSRARLISHAATVGGKLTRNDVNVWMGGEYADATINGLVVLGGTQHCDNHTLLRHEKANCPSHELYKHVLDGKSTCVFKGQIFVQKDAQKTDSKQTNKSLLLSDDAVMNSQPALEIYADDVKCTHGSTTGPVDEEMVFYLRSRGVSAESARHLLSYAFAADVTRRMKVEAVRQRLEDLMAARHNLPQDLRITDLGAHNEAAR